MIYRDLDSLTKIILYCQDKCCLCCFEQELFPLLSVFYSLSSIPIELQHSLVKSKDHTSIELWNSQGFIKKCPALFRGHPNARRCLIYYYFLYRSVVHVLILMNNYQSNVRSRNGRDQNILVCLMSKVCGILMDSKRQSTLCVIIPLGF